MPTSPDTPHERACKKQGLEEIGQHIEVWQNERYPYAEARYILALHSRDAERFDEGVLNLGNGERKFVLTTEELTALKEEAEAADNRIRVLLGLDHDIDILVFSHTVFNVSRPHIGETALARQHPDTMYNFLRSVQALSALTGLSYEVWSNSYGTRTSTIDSSTDILSLLRENFEEEIAMQAQYRANPHLSGIFKERLTPDILRSEYGLPY
jgi:hypothetical protein